MPGAKGGREAWGSHCQNCSGQWGTVVGARVLPPAPQGSTQGSTPALGSPGSVPTGNPASLGKHTQQSNSYLRGKVQSSSWNQAREASWHHPQQRAEHHQWHQLEANPIFSQGNAVMK